MRVQSPASIGASNSSQVLCFVSSEEFAGGVHRRRSQEAFTLPTQCHKYAKVNLGMYSYVRSSLGMYRKRPRGITLVRVSPIGDQTRQRRLALESSVEGSRGNETPDVAVRDGRSPVEGVVFHLSPMLLLTPFLPHKQSHSHSPQPDAYVWPEGPRRVAVELYDCRAARAQRGSFEVSTVLPLDASPEEVCAGDIIGGGGGGGGRGYISRYLVRRAAHRPVIDVWLASCRFGSGR